MSEDSIQEPTEPARAAIEDILKRRLGEVVQGAAADIAKYAAEMSVDLTMAAALQDQTAMRHLAAQTRMLGEKHRLAASRSGWAVFEALTLDIATAVAAGMAVEALQ